MGGNLPSGWVRRSVSDLIAWDAPGFWGDEPVQDSAVPVLRSTNFTDDGWLDLEKVAYRTFPGNVLAEKVLRPNDVLLERSGGGPNKPVGRVIRFQEENPYYFSNFIQALRGSDQAEPGFLFYLLWWLHASGTTKMMQQATTGIRNLAYKDYLAWSVRVPPLPEQRKIAEILGSVDEAIRATEAVIEQTRKVKEGLLQELLTKGIGHTKFKQTEIGEIPMGWEVKSLQEVTTKITDGTHQGVTTSEEGTHRFLYVTCVRPNKIIWKNAARVDSAVYEEISRGREPCPGAILYTAVGATLGYAAVVDTDEKFSFQRHLAILYPKKKSVLPGYVAAFLNSPGCVRRVWTLTVGNAQPSITLGELRKLRLPVPPLGEQESIDERLQALDGVIHCSEREVLSIRSMKAGLLQDLLTGKVRVKV